MTDCIVVDVGDGAQMTVPTARACWLLQYHLGAVNGPAVASALDSFVYLLTHCTKDEARRRIKLMRAALDEAPTPDEEDTRP